MLVKRFVCIKQNELLQQNVHSVEATELLCSIGDGLLWKSDDFSLTNNQFGPADS